MGKQFIVTVVGLIILFGSSNYYIGLRFWQSIEPIIGQELAIYYWILFFLVAGTYFWGRIGAIYFPGDFSDRMIFLGSYWLGMNFYLFLSWFLYDIGIFLGRYIGFLPLTIHQYTPSTSITILLVVSSIVAYGAHKAYDTTVRHYHIEIDKQRAACERLHIVMLSDLHLGLLVGREQLQHAVNIINKLKPDLVLLPGDIIDENIGAFVENRMPDILCDIRSRFGVFGVLGSHEYIYGHADKAITYLNQSGVTILRDECIQLPNGVYLAGRDDLLREQLVGTPRATLKRIVKDCKEQYPIILMDHQPVDLQEAQSQKIALQLSGHTHHGQIFPLNFLIPWFFKLDWGYLKNGIYQLIVSSGYGTWGPPIRLGTSSEIVDINISFVPTTTEEKFSGDTI